MFFFREALVIPRAVDQPTHPYPHPKPAEFLLPNFWRMFKHLKFCCKIEIGGARQPYIVFVWSQFDGGKLTIEHYSVLPFNTSCYTYLYNICHWYFAVQFGCLIILHKFYHFDVCLYPDQACYMIKGVLGSTNWTHAFNWTPDQITKCLPDQMTKCLPDQMTKCLTGFRQTQKPCKSSSHFND